MKKSILILILAVGLLGPQLVPAQGTLYLSNLGQTSISNRVVGSDSWLAQCFNTGSNSNGYVLNSVQLLMDAASGNPSGLAVLLYSFNYNTISPGSSLGTLNGSLDPVTPGTYTYTASGITLSRYTLYLVVLTAATPIATGAYGWSAAQSDSGQSTDQWWYSIYFSSSDGSNWNPARSYWFQLGIFATPVPEPATYALAGLGLIALSFWRRRQ